LDVYLASPKRLGRKPFSTQDPAIFRLLREAARLLVEGEAKSDRDALMRVSGGGDRFESLKKKWPRVRSGLMRGAERARDIEKELKEGNLGAGQIKIISFHLSEARKASRGTYALINQNSTDWDPACRAGWHPVEFLGDGEALMRRDGEGFMSAREFELSEPIQRWSREMAVFFGEDR
jgi:hypothetical protein